MIPILFGAIITAMIFLFTVCEGVPSLRTWQPPTPEEIKEHQKKIDKYNLWKNSSGWLFVFLTMWLSTYF